MAIKYFEILAPDKIPKLGPQIGRGDFGEIYQLDDKAIKFSMHAMFDDHRAYDFSYNLNKCLFKLKNDQPPAYANVYDYFVSEPIINNNSIKRFDNRINIILISYITDLLLPISDDEKKVFMSIGIVNSGQAPGSYKNISSINKIDVICQELLTALDFDPEKVIFFSEKLRGSIVHNDIHCGNIMKDSDGYFKLIDFDSLTLHPKLNIKKENYETAR